MRFNKLLIANRGEIALRIIRTSHKMGISVVAVTTEAEKNSQHAKLADEVVIIGDGPVGDSYLNIEKLINAALKTNAKAIHPGYGFLSQSTEFVKICDQNSIKFIGPSEKSMHQMGSKSEAKKIMEKCNVPIIKGYHQENQDPKFLFEKAKEVGFPVMIKATMGGGGKGMRLSTTEADFYTQLESAKNEAKNAFGNDAMIIEKFVVDPKHIEVQILGDEHGHVFDLFERDCSVQRRNQKIFEESPSNLDPAIIQEIRKMGVRAAESVGYYNAGTVEFLYEKHSKRFYFMEMNTRLQVEHPVSEMVTGIDIVELQLRVAQGENLKDLKIPKQPKGHAIEARICAEDPFNSFIPSIGKVTSFNFMDKPVLNSDITMNFDLENNYSNVRFDTFLIKDNEIVRFYDSMIGKLIVHGRDRTEALNLLQNALKKIEIAGVQTNIEFLNNIVKEEHFRNYDYSLHYFENHASQILNESGKDFQKKMIFIAIDKLFPGMLSAENGVNMNFRNNSLLRKMYRFSIGKSYSLSTVKTDFTVNLIQKNISGLEFMVKVNVSGEKAVDFEVEVISKINGVVTAKVNGAIEVLKVHQIDSQKSLLIDGTYYSIEDKTMEPIFKNALDLASGNIKSPMPGTVFTINVKEGDVVKKGTFLISIEAMKMEHKVLATFDMKIKKVIHKVKDFVENGGMLFEVEKI